MTVLVLLSAGCGVTGLGTKQRKPPTPAPSPAVAKEILPAPPWQLWEPDPRSEPMFADAERLLDQGQLDEAIIRYRQIETSAPSGSRLREEAFARRVAVELRRGRGKPVLDEVSRWVRDEGRSLQDVGPLLGLVVSFAYVYEHEWNQVYAWLSLVNRRVGGKGAYARRALATASRLAASLNDSDLDAASARWEPDPFVGPVLAAERLRRSKGGRQDPDAFAGWLPREVYSTPMPWEGRTPGQDVATAGPPVGELPPPGPPPEGTIVLGSILPVTGKFANHARYVEQGLRLALDEYRSKPGALEVQLAVADSTGDALAAGREYDRLVRDERATVILGPLLVKSSEEVARHADQLGIPFVTFTKKPGITQLSKVAFRLGATADNQSTELLGYVTGELGAGRFCTVYPRDSSGQEFAESFRKVVAGRGTLVAESSYAPNDKESMEAAVRELETKGCEATFIPDELEDLQPLLQARSQSALRTTLLLGPALWNDPVAVRGFAPLLEGAVYVTPYFQGSPRPQVVDFVAKYRSHYSSEPELLAAQGYDAMQFVLRALERSVAERRPLVEALRSADSIDGVTGKLSVAVQGEINRRMSVLRVSNGEIIEVMTAGSVTGFMPNEPPKDLTTAGQPPRT